MKTGSLLRKTAAAASAVAAITAAAIGASATSPRFYPDDPVWVEHDTEDARSVKPHELSLLVDLATNIISGDRAGSAGPARNVNTVDEVPDSSWFTNRIGHRPMTAAEIAQGPDTTSGPAPGAWKVTSSKSDGVTPGFTIEDANRTRWFLKFDPPGYRGMATGTEVVATKLMWALGYNVPENHIAHLTRERLVVGAGAKFTLPGGRKRLMRRSDIDDLLERANREPDGSYRVVASKALPGTPVGRIQFVGTRPDDPNDVVPHEDRRELRGYGVLAAWLNHVDAKAINSLDTLVTANGRSFVRHHLIDFGSALGSGGIGPADYWAGAEYLVEPGQVGRQMIAFGFAMPKWRTASFYEARSIGRLPKDNAGFDPESWKPRVPNQAFLNARADDKFWAARKLAALTTPLLRAAVQAGQFGDPAAEEVLVRVLADRRDAIARAYLPAVNPIVDLWLDTDGTLAFRNAAVDADVEPAPRGGYRAVWATFDNATRTSTPLGESAGAAVQKAPVRLPHGQGAFVSVQIGAVQAAEQSWETPVQAYFRLDDGGWRLVGLERMGER